MLSNDFNLDYFIGIQYGDFDGKITASSEYNPDHSVKGCKLNKLITSEPWHASAWVASKSDEKKYIEVNFGKEYLINGISIQGRGDCNQYVTKFRVLYSLDGNNFVNLSEFKGNTDNVNIVKRRFPIPVYATAIRVQILECYDYPALRFDLHYIPSNIPQIIKDQIISKYIK